MEYTHPTEGCKQIAHWFDNGKVEVSIYDDRGQPSEFTTVEAIVLSEHHFDVTTTNGRMKRFEWTADASDFRRLGMFAADIKKNSVDFWWGDGVGTGWDPDQPIPRTPETLAVFRRKEAS